MRTSPLQLITGSDGVSEYISDNKIVLRLAYEDVIDFDNIREQLFYEMCVGVRKK